MKLYKEVTKFTGQTAANHWYLLDDSESTMIGYRKFGEGEVTLFRTALPFYHKGRKLVLQHDFGPTGKQAIRVEGSNGRIHTVTLGDTPRCSCEAFRFRGNCKHIAIALEDL
jgi:hypothetical protein